MTANGTAAPQAPATIIRRVITTPIGPLTLAAGSAGVRAVLWPGEDGTRAWRAVADAVDEADAPEGAEVRAARAHLDRAEAELAEYFDGRRRTFDVPLDPAGTPFQLQVWEVLRSIPYGSTMSYGEQAAALGDSRKARAVGAANGRNPLSILVPCHRVVATSGALTGFAGGVDTKAWLLEHERAVLAAG
jgi:methylated-DNA-[protein]-cysteine S-methyltransferase